MRKVIVIDAETDPFEHGVVPKPFIWGAYEDEFGFRTFNDAASMVGWLKDQKAIVYAHNGGKFDFLFLADYFQPDTEIRIINGRLAKFKIGDAEFRDSYLILPIPLKDFKKDKIDYSIMKRENRDKPGNRHKIIKYLKGDCEYLHELISHFIKTNGPKLTLASAALANWRKISGLEPPKTTADFFETYGQYYYGGRVECFQKGIFKRPVKVFDINSAYPYAMLAQHPYGTEVSISEKLPKNIEAIQRSFIEISAASLGAFPFHGSKGFAFPSDGEIRHFKITGWEYLAARETGHLKDTKITLVREFKQSISFTEYVEHYFKIKKAAKKGSPEYIQAKLFLNGLYGKFAANPHKYRQFMFVNPAHIDYTEETTDWRNVDEVGPWALMMKPVPDEFKRFYHVALGASVTGFVRAYAWKNAIVPAKGLFYIDTDGVHAEDVPGLAISDKLGDWNIEFEATNAAYAGKKLYALIKMKGKKLDDKKIASKGVRLNAAQIFKIAAGKTVTYKQKAPTMSIRRGISFLEREIRMT